MENREIHYADFKHKLGFMKRNAKHNLIYEIKITDF